MESPEKPEKSSLPSESAAETTETADFYEEDGLMVFTAMFHRKRGACCKTGCRHCPYGFKDKSKKI